ncbi:MAG: RNA methyltransferase [Thermoanaerobaculia bacterium]|nr:RNA methyltransferase [Thermoanaerobaculia bacterium]
MTLPVVVLVRPQQEGNIGAVARAMANMGLTELRLVEPAPELGDTAFAFAMHAHSILLAAQRYASLAAALADCGYVVATASMRDRLWPHAVVAPRALPEHLAAHAADARVALIFGAEVSGLTSDELAHASVLVSIPAAPANPTLNLAQAVLLVAYELYVARGTPGAIAIAPVSRATVFQIEHLFGRLQELLSAVGFARDTTIRRVARDLRQLLARAELSEREAALLSGLLRRTGNALARGRKAPPA